MATFRASWFHMVFTVKGSVIPAVGPKVLLCSGFGVLISVLASWKWVVGWPILGSAIPSVVLGLLLVFRTNTAYERFWEGRKAWGALVNTIRNLTRRIWVLIEEQSPSDHLHKADALKLTVGFAIATKLHLRKEPVTQELLDCVGEHQGIVQEANNPPLCIAFLLEDYLQQQYRRGRIDFYQISTMNSQLDAMIDVLGVCERILKTPIPMAYAIHLKQLLLFYCLLLPFEIVGEIGFWTGPIVALVSFTLFGIEEIGLEIENPFGRDPNDLPLDEICQTMGINVEYMMTLKPTAFRHLEADAHQASAAWIQPSI